MSIDARKTSEQDWKYVSEGGATIVFSYVGPPSEDLTGMVLRLRKAKLADLEGVAQGQNEDVEYDAEVDDSTVLFQARVTSRLVPPANLPKLVPCRVSYKLLSSLSDASAKIRPSKRTSVDGIDTRKRRAVLATDLIGFESGSNGAAPRSFAVEIKPKWAFLPNPKYLSPQTRDAKTRHSRFVMHSYYRSHSGHSKPEVESTYDPLDLFSGYFARVERAVGSLWDSWVRSSGSANNLKIFVGGKTVDPALKESLGTLAPLLGGPEQPSFSDLRSAFVKRITSLVATSPVLPILARLQRTLDSLDIEGLDLFWTKYHADAGVSPVPPLGSGQSQPTLEEWESFTTNYLSKCANNGKPVTDTADESAAPITSTEELRYHILAYLMSATFKDCSIILRLPFSAPPPGTAETGSITAIDLDPKDVDRLETWKQLDRDIVSTYARYKGYIAESPAK